LEWANLRSLSGARNGFDLNGRGTFPRPQMQVSNVLSAITALLLNYSDLLGAKVTRRRTLAKYLDAVNFDGGVNPDADPTAEFPADVYFVDRKASEDRDHVTFELAAALDVAGVRLPRRQVIQNICTWKYRGAECGYTGAPILSDQDTPLTVAQTDAGQTLLDAYAAMVSARAALSVAIATLSARSYTKDAACELELTATQGNLLSYWAGAGDVFTPGSKSGVFTWLENGVYLFNEAFWNGARVSLGATYRMGALQTALDGYKGYLNGVYGDLGRVISFYAIEEWLPGAGCAAATTAYNAASSARDAAQAVYDSAVTAYNAALAALPGNDPLYSVDSCGKRLSSCKMRFGASNPLPFGSFPGAGLVK
jgi:lambda family phage minor tail protein L